MVSLAGRGAETGVSSIDCAGLALEGSERLSDVDDEFSDDVVCSDGASVLISSAVDGAICVPSADTGLASVSPSSMLADAHGPLDIGLETALTPATRAPTANNEHAA